MLNILEINEEISKNICICLSSSKVCGIELRKTHYKLGIELARFILKNKNIKNKNIAVIMFLRAGLPFGLGLSDELETNGNNVDIFFDSLNCLNEKYDYIIFADAVINSGKTIIKEIDKINNFDNVIIATNVLSNKNIDILSKYNIYAVRTSNNSYIGSKDKLIVDGRGPDTGDRLFSNSLYI